MLVFFASRDDLISNFFGVYRHATPGCHSQRFELIRCLDEFLLAPNFPLWALVWKEPFM
jgi:hypothetical protein